MCVSFNRSQFVSVCDRKREFTAEAPAAAPGHVLTLQLFLCGQVPCVDSCRVDGVVVCLRVKAASLHWLQRTAAPTQLLFRVGS